jgi:NAD(P)H-flavin reductase
MKVTESGAGKHRQLQIEDYLQRVSAEQKEYAGVCGPPKMAETDITDTTEQKMLFCKVMCNLWNRRIPNGTYGGVGGRLPN